ncbi:AAA family ATPase [Flavobacterium terrigena]|uniref:Predicted ATPase n=1 Tax=Flavobacterium terrigena TaxID=402734 RepID=A0A1H6UIJ9_9FLAO|nr:DUF3696 domain-containing protein [Flavobacterium terrigena]SEI90544.1 Predicted ATPase [Flavobacterium terrigena]
MLDKIVFKGYKSFKERTELELKPITVIFGKNSSGKSSIAKLPTLIEGSFSLEFDEPFMYINKGIELGAEYRDLFFRREIQGNIDFELISGKDELKITVVNTPTKPMISKWEISSEKMKDVEYDYKSLLEEEHYQSNLKGFLITGHPSEKIFSLKTDYLGPFRVKPQRIFYINDLKNPNSIDGLGEKAYHLIAQDEELEEKVSNWFKENFDGWELFVDRKQPYYEIKIRRNSDWSGINIVDVGQGMSQALPIIVKALYKNECEPTLNILEQPELHLHPAAHGNLAELISNSIIDSKNKYLIETHSKNFILRLRTLIAKGNLDYNNLNLYFVDYDEDKDCSILKKIEVTEQGEVTSWPDHIFNESFDEAVALKLAQKNK